MWYQRDASQMIFSRKNSKLPLSPPPMPSFWKAMLRFFSGNPKIQRQSLLESPSPPLSGNSLFFFPEIREQITIYKSKICNDLLDQKWLPPSPPFGSFPKIRLNLGTQASLNPRPSLILWVYLVKRNIFCFYQKSTHVEAVELDQPNNLSPEWIFGKLWHWRDRRLHRV